MFLHMPVSQVKLTYELLSSKLAQCSTMAWDPMHSSRSVASYKHEPESQKDASSKRRPWVHSELPAHSGQPASAAPSFLEFSGLSKPSKFQIIH